MHFDFGVLEMHLKNAYNRKKNHEFCKCIFMDFGNDFQFCKWILNF
jgi:hypothetical protein